MKIAVDAFGGDNAPDEVIKGAASAVKAYGVTVVLTGDKSKIEQRISELGVSSDGLEICDADGVIEIEDDPKQILKEKKDCSMGKALALVASREADAMVSAGSTAALVMGGTLTVKRIKGVKRPAMAPILPGESNRYILLDGGANIDCRPEMLRQFAIMGSIYMEKIMGVEAPRVALLNVGAEEEKGRELEQGAYELLGQTDGINFIGNIEGRDAALGGADVIVTDGFTGNIYLKTVEGMGKFMKTSLKKLFYRNFGTMLSSLLCKKGIRGLIETMDYRETGGSPLLGTACPVIKAHGSSDALAFKNAIRQAKEFCEKNVIEEIERALGEKGDD